ncbi:MAG TPA: hypothetical protein VF476_13860 [Chitinophagaceae bacterium]
MEEGTPEELIERGGWFASFAYAEEEYEEDEYEEEDGEKEDEADDK